MPEQGVDQPPERIAGQADRDQDEEHLAEGLLRDRFKSPLLVGGPAADAQGKLEGEDADDPVDQAARDEAGAGQPLEAVALCDLLPTHTRALDGRGLA